MVELGAVQSLIAGWWFDYDHGSFDRFGDYFTADARFSCRSDSGQTDFEEFIRADLTGRDEVVAWQVEHRTNSPYPLRHFVANLHLIAERPDEADFRSYLLCTHIVDGAVSNLASGVVAGTVRNDGGRPRFSDFRVVLDFADSTVFSEATLQQPA